jgi:hypothetical protein
MFIGHVIAIGPKGRGQSTPEDLAGRGGAGIIAHPSSQYVIDTADGCIFGMMEPRAYLVDSFHLGSYGFILKAVLSTFSSSSRLVI